MGLYDRTESWSNNHIEIVKRCIPNDKYCLGNSYELKYTSKIPFTTEHLVISYNKRYKLFIVWNAMIHRECFKGNTHTLSVPKSEIENITKNDSYINEINVVVKNIDSPVNKKESVYIVGEEALSIFCQNYLEYLYNDIDNCEDGNKEEFKREYKKAISAKRNPSFRKRVLEKYNYTCIVCGCKEQNVLQAAHIIPVSNSGNDDTENGICLCANHHLLYDALKLEIDLDNKNFKLNKSTEINSSWYKEAEKRNFKLFLPNTEVK